MHEKQQKTESRQSYNLVMQEERAAETFIRGRKQPTNGPRNDFEW